MKIFLYLIFLGAHFFFSSQVESADNAVLSDCEVCPQLVRVPSGSFELRNAPWGPGHPHDEGFFYRVIFSNSFNIGKYEVTVREWDSCVLDGKCPDVNSMRQKKGSHPVTELRM